MPAMKRITVIKRDLQGEELWRYQGVVRRREGSAIHLEAPFNGKEAIFKGTTIRAGDLFLETYYTDRWYNIFEIRDREDGGLKGWYCNIGKPAMMEDEGVLSYVDLALDLWVAPDGRQSVLDEEEFLGMEMDPATRTRAREALEELRGLFEKDEKPGA
jgi:predicted RNA-binding protein associated with RNAse of E/G family